MGKTTDKTRNSTDNPTFSGAEGIVARQMPSVPMDWIDHHRDIEFNFLRRGCITYLLGGRRVTLRAGEVAIFWAAQPHQVIETAGDDLIDWIHVPLETFLGWGIDQSTLARLLAGTVLRGGGSAESDALAFDRWVADLSSGRPHRLHALALELRARVDRCMDERDGLTEPDPLVRDPALDAMVYIAANSQKSLSVAVLARRAGLHPDYLGRVFRERFGQTIVEAITRHRLFRAQTLLLTDRRPITEVAFDAGFGSLSQFNKAFKDSMGMSPREYRSRHRR